MTEYHPITTSTRCFDCKKLLKSKTAKRCGSCSQKGLLNHRFGKHTHHNRVTRKKIAIAHIGSKNPAWKGNKVGYHALHSWIRYRLKKPTLCQNCELFPPYDLANISGLYKRDLKDWEWLCRDCHMVKDGRKEKYSFKKGIFYGSKYLTKNYEHI